jgi:hypothetical protein
MNSRLSWGVIVNEKGQSFRNVHEQTFTRNRASTVCLDLGNAQYVHAFRRRARHKTRRILFLLHEKCQFICWACIGRVLDDVWTTGRVIGMCIRRVLDDVWKTVVVIGLNSHQR